MRWTAAGWADVKFLGADRVREMVKAEADRVRGVAMEERNER